MAQISLGLKESDYDKFSEDDLKKIASGNYKSKAELFDNLSEDALKIIAGDKGPVPEIANASDQKTSALEAAQIGATKGITFGFRPAIGGVGAGIGAMVGTPGGLKEKLAAFSPAYQEARADLLKEQQIAEKEHPYASIGGNIAGSAATLPFTVLRGLKGAVLAGGAMGAGEAVSENKDIEDVALNTAKGAGLGAASYGLAKGVEKAAPVIKKGIIKVTDFLGEKAQNAFAKTASALTGETERNIKTFINKNKEVRALIKESGGDISGIADNVRDKISKDISLFRQQQNKQIGEALDNLNPEKIIDLEPITTQLEKVKARVNVKLKPEDAAQVDELIGKVKSLADENGKISLKELQEVKEFLQESGQNAYQKAGQLFQPGKLAQQAAKQSAREAKIIMDKAVPELKAANDKLFQLHRIEDTINKNLIASGKSESALLSAGGSEFGRNRTQLKQLGNIIGKDVIGEAEKLSSANAFINPNLVAKSGAGTTSTTRTLTGGAGGAAVGAAIGGPIGGAIGAVAGPALTSPAALKTAITTGIISKQALEKVLGFGIDLSEATMERLLPVLNDPKNADILSRIVTPQLGSVVDRRMQALKNNK